MGIADNLMGAETPKNTRTPFPGADDAPWRSTNELDPMMVGDRLGIERDGKRIKRCPSCGADTGVDYVRGGWKCLHASCASMAKNGFRTNIDSIMEIQKCSALDAARWAAATLGTTPPSADKPKRSEPEKARPTPASDEPPDDFYDRIAASIPEAADDAENNHSAGGKIATVKTKTGIRDGMEAAFVGLHERMKRGDKLAGVESGYQKLDYTLDGWQRKKMYVIGGRAGMGKSIVGLNLALRFAEAGSPVLYFTLEMTNEEQVMRSLFNRAEVGMWRMKKNALYPEHWSRLTKQAATLANLPMHFDEAAGLTDVEIERRVIAHKREHGELFCVVIDHTLLVHGTNERQPRREQLNGIIERFKNVAKQHDVCVIALAQLNRALESRAIKDKRPQMSDLKETGAFEEFTDAAILLYREDYYHYNDPAYRRDNVIELIIPKIRGGRSTKVELKFIGSQCRMDPPDDDTPETEEGENDPPRDYNEPRGDD